MAIRATAPAETENDMTDANIDRPVLRVADLVTGDDRADGRTLLARIRAAIADHGCVAISFADLSMLTPTLVNEGLGPLLDDAPAYVLRKQIVLVDATRAMGDVINAAMRRAQDDRAPLIIDVPGSMGDAMRDDGHVMIDELTHAQMVGRGPRISDMSDETMERLFGDREDRGLRIIRCERDPLDMLEVERFFAGPLPTGGYDYRSANEQWSKRRARTNRRR